ncbi:MAG: type II toxin-antitoxin system VapC family toxin [Microbacteriaceae bacterium]
MVLLLDTQLLLWVAYEPARLSASLRDELGDERNTLFFSAASIGEAAIKTSLGRGDFETDARVMRRALLENGYGELAVIRARTAAVADLPALHRDPIDRLLVARARVEGVVLVAADAAVAAYGPPTRLG